MLILHNIIYPPITLTSGDNDTDRTASVEDRVTYLRKTAPRVFQLGVQNLTSHTLAVHDSLDDGQKGADIEIDSESSDDSNPHESF